jgi:peptide/nickel transport system ATP-binding protein
MKEKLLEVCGLTAGFRYEGRWMNVIRDVGFEVYQSEIVGIVGESGSGKSVTAKHIMRLIPSPPGRIFDGKILFEGKDIIEMSKRDVRKIRGNNISMIFQEPMTSLNPVFTCGDQICESIILHQRLTRKDAKKQTIEMLKLVGISSPETRFKAYPHELSGGMRQRVMIAIALSCNPRLLIADEPTTALDPTIQAQILDLIKILQAKTSMSVIYITHDLGVVAELCERVVVMYAGMVMETSGVKDLFKNPLHPYTRGLMMAMPRMNAIKKRLYTIEGKVPHFSEMPAGCPFNPRCPEANDECLSACPDLFDAGGGHMVRCVKFKRSSD